LGHDTARGTRCNRDNYTIAKEWKEKNDALCGVPYVYEDHVLMEKVKIIKDCFWHLSGGIMDDGY